PLTALREDLLNLLADVEAGLDFADEDLHFVEQKDMLLRLGNAMAHITLVGKQIDSRAIAGQTFRVVLTGRPNAGKSSLFNALAGARALVSEIPGTTRDYLVARFTRDGIPLELVDTPGWQAPQGEIESQAQALAQAQLQGAALILLCVEAGHELSSEETVLAQQQHPPVERIATKCDRNQPIQGWLPTSAVAPGGQEILLQRLSERIRNRPQVSLAPSLSRCKAHVAVCLDHLRRAHAVVLEEDPPEILALELREALAQLGEMVGAVYTDDLLDRIFSRFCIGK
ncbi:MAG: GTPase, partial [Gemmataceae bacterium]